MLSVPELDYAEVFMLAQGRTIAILADYEESTSRRDKLSRLDQCADAQCSVHSV